jgi:hypothetical protein
MLLLLLLQLLDLLCCSLLLLLLRAHCTCLSFNNRCFLPLLLLGI